jgi:hypothetical protein
LNYGEAKGLTKRALQDNCVG